MSKKKKMRILAIDTSASPGFAVLDYMPGELPTIVYADALKTDSKKPDSERYEAIAAFVTLLVFRYGPFDVVCREHFTKGGSKRSTQLVFGAWSAVDMALGSYGYHTDAKDEIPPTQVKKAVTGKGKAEKDEVEQGVRKRLKLPDNYTFSNNSGGDTSDAVAVAIAWIDENTTIL